ncbi:MAG: TVP38/TMEM64 family protein [Acidobacteria bacterium]|nr:TVP38/TMEM64 family protein [Acidobacteriota bacterium]
MTAIGKKRLLALILVLAVAASSVALWQSEFLQRLSNRDQLIVSLRSAGVEGPLLCIAVQFIQVVIFIIPGEITQFAAGYVFGAAMGFVYSVAGIMLGAAFNFFFARLVGRPVVEKFIPRPTLDKIDHALNNAKGKSAMFLLFLLPGMPKDAMSYGAGLTSMGLVEFVVVTGLARSPALLVSILLGAQAYRRDYRGMIIIGLVVAAAVAGYYLYEKWRKQGQGS